MAKPFHQLLADSLRRVKQLADHQIVRSEQLSRIDRERLLKVGSLHTIIRGWYLFCPPHVNPGESTLWYASFWDFIRLYLRDRFGENYCLAAEASLDLLLGKNYLPPQIVVMAKSGGSISVALPHQTSLLIYQENKNFPREISQCNGLNILPLEHALCRMPPGFYRQNAQEAEIALRMLQSPEKILTYLLQEGRAQAAGRIVGALRHIKNNELANAIFHAMKAAGFSINENNPFQEQSVLSSTSSLTSPYSIRLETLWEKTRADIIKLFPKPTRSKQEHKQLIKTIDDIYVQDAYHSLSIEGYQVSEHLIEKIAQGNWHPEQNTEDLQQKNAMAAKGYYEAFKAVKSTIKSMLKSHLPIEILRVQFPSWYLALFSPAVMAGIVSAKQLAGFRNQQVYIRNARHVPPPSYAIRDCMETLFACLAREENAAVKAVLTHWLIGFIHPYADGNGRMARFAMNALLVSNGYPWTIIHVKNRQVYLHALEKASIHGDIQEFCRLIIKEMKFTFTNN